MADNGELFDRKAEEAIAAHVHMISVCRNANDPTLPTQCGTLTQSFLQVLYAYRESGTEECDLSWLSLLTNMKLNIRSRGYDYDRVIPQLTCSKMNDPHEPHLFVNNNEAFGIKRAVLIGINYEGQDGELIGCHQDVEKMKIYLENEHRFKPENIVVLMDDGENTHPTKKNILKAYDMLTQKTKRGDTVFCHYCGHACYETGGGGEQAEGLIPIDFQKKGCISGNDLLLRLVKPMPEGVLMIYLMDCCLYGPVMDLPYCFKIDEHVENGMQRNSNMNFELFDRVKPCKLWCSKK